MSEDIGEVEKSQSDHKCYEETQIEWRIRDFVSVAESTEIGEDLYSPSFSIEDDSPLYFSLCPKSFHYPQLICFYLGRKRVGGAIKYKFGYKRSDGTVLNFFKGILPEYKHYSDLTRTIKLSELLSKKSEFLPHDVLTVTCILRRETTHPIQPVAEEETKPLKLIGLDKLSQNFQDLFGDNDTCDTTLKINGKDYNVHRSVLIARSPVFAATFKHDTSERQTGIITIPDCDPNSFQEFLQYLYCGRLEEMSFQNALNLYVTSDKYDVQELKEFCVQYLIQCMTVDNVCDAAVLADKYDEMQLLSAVQDFFNENNLRIFLTPEWKLLLKKDYRLVEKLLREFSKSKLKE